MVCGWDGGSRGEGWRGVDWGLVVESAEQSNHL